jgi:hypothetical protein
MDQHAPSTLTRTVPFAGNAAGVGVVCYDSSTAIDEILADAAERLTVRGLLPAGLLQSFGQVLPNGKRSMWLDDITTGERIRLDLPRGAGATTCFLDPDALAHGAYLLQQAVRAGAMLIFANRFGGEEAAGRGMRAEIADAICSAAAVLIPVRHSLLPDLELFLGEAACLVAPTAPDIVAWAEQLKNRYR